MEQAEYEREKIDWSYIQVGLFMLKLLCPCVSRDVKETPLSPYPILTHLTPWQPVLCFGGSKNYVRNEGRLFCGSILLLEEVVAKQPVFQSRLQASWRTQQHTPVTPAKTSHFIAVSTVAMGGSEHHTPPSLGKGEGKGIQPQPMDALWYMAIACLVSGFWGWMGEVSRCTAFVLDPLYVLQLPATTEHQMSYLKVLRLKCSVTFWGAR
eukprot:1139462-Pelagomonas_calceolata.AAC.6